ncbi:MAG: hypothetical protein FWG22_06110, partial [Prolixibacteraceae bacterium]|nr:hypothetical protein [Prolixibacteraceae bacterium]
MNALKKLSILFLLLIPVWSLNAQDIITKKNAEEIKAKVVEVSKDEVKYKRYGSESGPTYTLPVSDIFMIKYENGDKDVFGNETSSDKPTTAAPSRPTPVQSQTATPSAAPERGNAALPEKARRGYVGIALGAASLLEDYSDVTSGGFQFNLVNFGYLFGKHVGMTASIMGISYVWDRYSDATVGFVGLTAGPLFTFGPDLKVV